MGKRELLIILIFAAVGMVVYRVTAPPPKNGQGFSFSRLWSSTKRQIQGSQAVGSVTTTGSIAIGPAVTSLRVAGVSRGIQILGEARKDIAYEMRIESSGPDQAAAEAFARKAILQPDDLGSELALAVVFPKEESQWAALTLHVPAGLAVRLEGGSGARAANLASLELDRATGIITAEHITGAVSGALTSGDLTVAGAGTISLTLGALKARLSQVAHSLTLTTRSGRCDVADSHGLLTIDETNTELAVTNQAGPIHATGAGGRVTITAPQQALDVNIRNAPITLDLDAAVPVMAIAAGERLRVTFAHPPAVTIDAVASGGGHIDASDFGLTPDSDDANQEQRLNRPLGAAGAPRVTLRNARGDIVIGKGK